MQLGMIGLGRMGANMVRRLERAGHECVGFDIDTTAVGALVGEGMTGATSLVEFVAQLQPPRHVWIMVPAAFVDTTIDGLAPLLDAATRSSTAATRGTATTSTGRSRWPPTSASTTSTSARAAARTASNAATA